MIQFKTGRNYGTEQVLNINVISETADEFDMFNLVAHFEDTARGIQGKVETVRFPHETVGEAVLAAYDLGLYR